MGGQKEDRERSTNIKGKQRHSGGSMISRRVHQFPVPLHQSTNFAIFPENYMKLKK